MKELFSKTFLNHSLTEIIKNFNTPTRFGYFIRDMTLYTKNKITTNMMEFLLRNQLIQQEHTYFFLLPPISYSDV